MTIKEVESKEKFFFELKIFEGTSRLSEAELQRQIEDTTGSETEIPPSIQINLKRSELERKFNEAAGVYREVMGAIIEGAWKKKLNELFRDHGARYVYAALGYVSAQLQDCVAHCNPEEYEITLQ